MGQATFSHLFILSTVLQGAFMILSYIWQTWDSGGCNVLGHTTKNFWTWAHSVPKPVPSFDETSHIWIAPPLCPFFWSHFLLNVHFLSSYHLLSWEQECCDISSAIIGPSGPLSVRQRWFLLEPKFTLMIPWLVADMPPSCSLLLVYSLPLQFPFEWNTSNQKPDVYI
jgi:hypothetical protein